MNGLYSYYEAPRRFEPDGFVDPIDLPKTIRAIAPPNAKSSHALAGALCRSLGATRDLHTKAHGENDALSSAAAWSLADGVTDVYIASAEDLTRPAILDCLDFAGRIGAHLHLVFSYGQAHVHGDLMSTAGFDYIEFADLPEPLRTPTPPVVRPSGGPSSPFDGFALPAADWTSFRATYRSTLPHDIAERCDQIYLDAYHQARASPAATVDDIAALAGHLWQQHGVGETERLLTTRAIQAAMFRNGFLVRIDLRHFTRHVQQNYVNLMTPHHYELLRGFVKPWRAAATVLHAHHVSTEQSLALTTDDVTRDGHIPSLNIAMPPEARRLVAAQRWHQLITQDANPTLFNASINGLRRGIRTVVTELDLPVIAYWRTLTNDKGRGNIGIKVEALA